MTKLKTYKVTEDGKKFKEYKAANLDNLRSQHIHSGLPTWKLLAVHSESGKFLGGFSIGMSDYFWTTPKGNLYILFRDGTIRGEYR